MAGDSSRRRGARAGLGVLGPWRRRNARVCVRVGKKSRLTMRLMATSSPVTLSWASTTTPNEPAEVIMGGEWAANGG